MIELRARARLRVARLMENCALAARDIDCREPQNLPAAAARSKVAGAESTADCRLRPLVESLK